MLQTLNKFIHLHLEIKYICSFNLEKVRILLSTLVKLTIFWFYFYTLQQTINSNITKNKIKNIINKNLDDFTFTF